MEPNGLLRNSCCRHTFAIILISSLALLLSARNIFAACRDIPVVRHFGSLAYAAARDVQIQYFGHNFFLITTRSGTRIVTDPLGPGWYPTPNVTADIVTVGREHYNHNYVDLVQGKPLILRGLGEYGAEWNKVNITHKDVLIYNVPVYHYAGSEDAIRGAAFVFDLGDLCIAHLGDLSQKLTPSQLKAFGKVDIALTPIGGRRTMGPDLAKEVLAQLKPKIAIPMHYRGNYYTIQRFVDTLNAKILESDTMVVSKSALPSSLEVRVLRPNGDPSYR